MKFYDKKVKDFIIEEHQNVPGYKFDLDSDMQGQMFAFFFFFNAYSILALYAVNCEDRIFL